MQSCFTSRAELLKKGREGRLWKSDLTSLCYLQSILLPDNLTIPLEYPQPLWELLQQSAIW